MKTPLPSYIFFLLLIAFFPGNIKAQDWDFASFGSEWYYTATEFGGYPESEYVKFWVSKDTLVEGKICRFIENDSERVVAMNNSNYSSVVVPPYVMYEEDKKVYKWYKEKFYLVLDFDVSVNDTVNLYLQVADIQNSYGYLPDTMYPCPSVVVNIDSIMVGEHYLKRIKVEPLVISEFIGIVIGSITYAERIGVFSDYIIQRTFPIGSWTLPYFQEIRCYYDDEISYTRADWEKRCDWRLDINTLNAQEFNVNIYPNPAADFVNIELTEDILVTNAFISIENAWGKNYLKQKIIEKQTRLDISMLPAGIYLVKIQTADNQFKVMKIVKF